MSPRVKFISFGLASIAIGLAIGVTLVSTQNKLLMAGFFGWIAIASFLLLRIRCPSCGVPVAYQGQFGRLSVYAGFARRTCQNCGHDLTK